MASSRKRPLSAAKTSPEDALVQTLMTTFSDCLWVVANPRHVSVTHSTTGDLVMAMGELVEYKPTQTDLPESVHRVAARIRAAQERQQQTCQDEQQQVPQHRPIYYLHARILRNANGTNVTLHTEALYARRQQLVAARLLSATPATTTTTDESSVWPGCGPPPYNNNNNDNKFSY
jgi:hypothetical protein